MELASRAAIGLVASGAVALWARRRGALSPSGAAAAVAIGTAICAGGGPAWLAVLLVFFATSTALGRLGRSRKAATKREFEKGDRRDGWQALANGGVAAAAALLAIAWPDGGNGRALAGAFLGALATANGDTWATEIGILSSREPWSLARLRRVPRGTSGAVSPLGMAATIAGAAAIGIAAACAPGAFFLSAGRAIVVAVASGTAGALGDSLLGATVQTAFFCASCGREVEAAVHHCGARCARVRGIAVVGNDAVNALATLVGAIVGAAIAAR